MSEKEKVSSLITYLYETMNGELVLDYANLDSENIEILLDYIEKLNNIINELEKANNKIKMALDYIQNTKGKDINYVATLLSGYPIEISEMREQFLESIGSDK